MSICSVEQHCHLMVLVGNVARGHYFVVRALEGRSCPVCVYSLFLFFWGGGMLFHMDNTLGAFIFSTCIDWLDLGAI